MALVEIPILALFAMRSPCWTWRISLKKCEIQKEKKRFGSHKYIRKSEHPLYFRWKKKWTPIPKFLANFDPFWGNLWIFSKIKQIFTIFNSFWSIKWTFFLFSTFFRHFSTFLKFYPKWPKSTKNPYSTLWIFCFWVSKSSF